MLFRLPIWFIPPPLPLLLSVDRAPNGIQGSSTWRQYSLETSGKRAFSKPEKISVRTDRYRNFTLLVMLCDF